VQFALILLFFFGTGRRLAELIGAKRIASMISILRMMTLKSIMITVVDKSDDGHGAKSDKNCSSRNDDASQWNS
jgi:hypothetical protein